MSRRLVKLQTLFAKLEGRYGTQDEAVQELGQQLRVLEQLEAERKANRREPAQRPSSDPASHAQRLL
jgi:hypothetical protein